MVDSILRAHIRSESIPETGIALSALFHIMPIPPQPLTRLLFGLSLLSAVANPTIFGCISFILCNSNGQSHCSQRTIILWLLLHVTCTSITSLCNLYLQHRLAHG